MPEIKEPFEVWTIKPKTKHQKRPLAEIIYVAGKITGENVVECVNKFMTAKMILKFSVPTGTIIRIPFDLPGIVFGVEHEAAMKICLDFIENHATGVYMLRDWTHSKGAREEHTKAAQTGKKIIYEKPVHA